MKKAELEKIVLACINDLISQEMSDSQAQLVIRFLDNLRERAADADQSDHFVSELKKKLKTLNSQSQ